MEKMKDLCSIKATLVDSVKEQLSHGIECVDAHEMGEVVAALSEWVISKNLQPEDNRADFYLKDAQKPGEVDKANQAAEKYNRALEQCKTGNMDLAKLQLKRMTGQGSCDMDAFCLLTLIYIKEKKSLSSFY